MKKLNVTLVIFLTSTFMLTSILSGQKEKSVISADKLRVLEKSELAVLPGDGKIFAVSKEKNGRSS